MPRHNQTRSPKTMPMPALRWRIRPVPGWGEFWVPAFVVRIDIDDPGRAGTHGWQVRYRKPSVFFGDSLNGLRRSPQKSLQEAINYLRKIFRGTRSCVRSEEKPAKQIKTGKPGIRITHRLRKNRRVAEIYIRIDAPVAGHPPKNIYVGTENTVTRARIKEKLVMAEVEWAAMRMRHELAHRRVIVASRNLRA